MKNKDLIEKLQQLNPEADVVISTGNTFDDIEDFSLSWGGPNLGEGADGMDAEFVYVKPVSTDNSEHVTIPDIIKVSAGVRYWENGRVNGENDISYDKQEEGIQPKMPCAELREDEYRWNLEIDPETGIILNWPKGNTADVYYKVCDDCEIEYYENGKLICNNEKDYYVPKFLSPDGEGYGDYMIMSIDGNGQIANWSKSYFQKWVNTMK